ncbi:MAG: hypothetical protein H6993_12685 [Pseudomonadales bacterium]|nr:hypothetical protein [Pseudomonadales bacterium]MCP5184814.1 hypothetical protein [Pseudomonadales bacterium]
MTSTDVVSTHPDGVPGRVSALILRVTCAWDRTSPVSYAAAEGLASAEAGGPLVEVVRVRPLLLSTAYGPNASFGETQVFHPPRLTNIVTTNLNSGGMPPWFASGFTFAATGVLQPAWSEQGATSFPFRKAILTLVVQPYAE